MSSERPRSQEVGTSSPGSGGEENLSTQERDGYVADRDERTASVEPDVVLDVPMLNVEEIDLEVEDLRAHVSLQAELADFVKINVGVDAYLDKVKLGIKGVEAQAQLKVRLEGILNTISRALDTIDRNPQVLGGAARGSAVEGASQDIGETTQEAGPETRPTEEMVNQAARATSSLLGETVDETGRTVRRTVDESGNITEAVLDEAGDVVDEKVTGNLDDLQVEEEYVDDQGQIVGRVRDESGNVFEEILDEEGNILDLTEETEDRDPDEEIEATDAARRKARDLGVQLSDVKGTGSGGRVLVRDVQKKAAK